MRKVHVERRASGRAARRRWSWSPTRQYSTCSSSEPCLAPIPARPFTSRTTLVCVAALLGHASHVQMCSCVCNSVIAAYEFEPLMQLKHRLLRQQVADGAREGGAAQARREGASDGRPDLLAGRFSEARRHAGVPRRMHPFAFKSIRFRRLLSASALCRLSIADTAELQRSTNVCSLHRRRTRCSWSRRGSCQPAKTRRSTCATRAPWTPCSASMSTRVRPARQCLVPTFTSPEASGSEHTTSACCLLCRRHRCILSFSSQCGVTQVCRWPWWSCIDVGVQASWASSMACGRRLYRPCWQPRSCSTSVRGSSLRHGL